MSDVRALLRQQRAARRIEHPHASYTEGGKLLCSLCSEPIKAESLWDTHLRSSSHRQRLLAAHQASNNSTTTATAGNNGAAPPSHKRRHSSTSDSDDGNDSNRLHIHLDQGLPKKRSRTDIVAPFSIEVVPDKSESSSKSTTPDKDKFGTPFSASRPTPPPALTRRASGTPALGVEMSIPSRPATPNSSSSTPKTGGSLPPGRSPLIPQEATMMGTVTATATTSRPATAVSSSKTLTPGPALLQQPRSQLQASALSATATTTTSSTVPQGAPKQVQDKQVDESEWAAFEADIATLEAPASPQQNGYSADAVISAPALTAAELQRQKEEEERKQLEQGKQTTAMESTIKDEEEDATRALEVEFEEMEELEERVRKLKEKRERLRRESEVKVGALGILAAGKGGAKEGGHRGGEKEKEKEKEKENEVVVVEEEEEDDDDDEEDEEWAGFRFRG